VVPPWRDVRVLRVAGQLAVVVAVALLVAYLASNLISAMGSRGLVFGYGFLNRTAGFDIAESPVPYVSTNTYGHAFLVGLINTIFVSVVGIVLATILGVIVGVARLSPNWLLNRSAAGYVEAIRNTPLLVQLFLIYFAVLLQLPPVAEAVALPGSIFLTQRGIFMPAPHYGPGFPLWIAFIAAGLLVAIGARVVAARREKAGLRAYRMETLGIVALLVLAAAGWFVAGPAPLSFELPAQAGFNFRGGLALTPEFTALVFGLVIYTAAFIGEVVRGGIQAVRRGQLEAARALGLSEGQTLRLVIFPQALRIIVPPLTSQYLNLAKNSSLAIAIGYPDLFKVGQTMANQTGQPVPVIVMIMGTYLAISLVTSLLMNLYNRRVQVLER
jgi:general L-amino acid transport system permease protein